MTDCERSEHKGCLKVFKVGCLGFIGLFLLFIVAGTAWFFYMTREVTVHDEDLVVTFKNVPDEKNGYFALEKSKQAITESGFDTDTLCVTNVIPTDENLSAYKQFAEKHPDVLDSFYSVAEFEYCQAPLEDGVPMIAQKGLRVSGLITLGNLSLCHIESLIRANKYSEALDCLRSHIRVDRMLMKDAHGFLTGMLGIVIANRTCDLLSHHLSQGTFQKENIPVIQSVLLAFSGDEDYLQMVRAEYSTMKEILTLTAINIPAEIPVRLRRYAFNESVTLKQIEHYYRAMISCFSNPNSKAPVVKERTDPSTVEYYWRLIAGNVVGDLVYNISVPSSKGAGHVVLNLKAKKGLIGVYLALWNYYDEHAALPSDLESLVPAYLPELPRDPFGRGASFQYDPQKKLIFSVGNERSEKRSDLKISLGFVR